MITRKLFQVPAQAAAWGDTGKDWMGEIVQVHWNPTAADTGANAVMTLANLPREGDTGDGWIFATYTGLGADFTRAPRQPTHDAQGAIDQTDTGTPAAPAPVAFASDNCRIKVSGGPVSGRLYVWLRD